MSGEITSRFRALLGRLQTFKVKEFGTTSEDGFADDGKPDSEPAELGDANIITSLVKPTTARGGLGETLVLNGESRHIVAVDIDWPAHLIPSSTPGHHHLYVEIPAVPTEAYLDWLDASVKIGLVQQGYADAARARGRSDLRLPWVAKWAADGQTPAMTRPVDVPYPSLDFFTVEPPVPDPLNLARPSDPFADDDLTPAPQAVPQAPSTPIF
jgi:hypothetical protein